MQNKNALFVYDGRFYLAANKDAAAICAILSKMRLKEEDIAVVRAHGYTPRLTNGEEIGKVNIKV